MHTMSIILCFRVALNNICRSTLKLKCSTTLIENSAIFSPESNLVNSSPPINEDTVTRKN